MLILMQNYGIFTKITVCRSQDQRKQREQEKVQKKLRQEANNVATLQLMLRQQKRRVLGETKKHCRDIQNHFAISIQKECQTGMS